MDQLQELKETNSLLYEQLKEKIEIINKMKNCLNCEFENDCKGCTDGTFDKWELKNEKTKTIRV